MIQPNLTCNLVYLENHPPGVAEDVPLTVSSTSTRVGEDDIDSCHSHNRQEIREFYELLPGWLSEEHQTLCVQVGHMSHWLSIMLRLTSQFTVTGLLTERQEEFTTPVSWRINKKSLQLQLLKRCHRWEVSSVASAAFVGSNRISKSHDLCLISGKLSRAGHAVGAYKYCILFLCRQSRLRMIYSALSDLHPD